MEAPGNVLLVLQIGLLGSDTQLIIYPLSFCRSSRDLFPDKILEGVREEKLQHNDLWIFLKQTITGLRGMISSCF